jgi:hypothetical protein
MNWTDRRERFRAGLSGGRCIHPASVYDPISARIAEDLGFEAGMLAGSVASLTVLGARRRARFRASVRRAHLWSSRAGRSLRSPARRAPTSPVQGECPARALME